MISSALLMFDDHFGYLWISSLAAVGVFNCYNARSLDGISRGRKVLICNYAFACLFRSLFMTDVIERMCFMETFFNWPIVNRFVASIGEISFGLTVNAHVFPSSRWYKFGILPVCANCLSYLGVITRNVFFFVGEESLWFVFCLVVLFTLSTSTTISNPKLRARWAHFYLIATWSLYLLLEDIPGYYFQRLRHIEHNKPTFWVSEGVFDASTCWTVTQKFSDWIRVFSFHTLYFLTGPTALVMYYKHYHALEKSVVKKIK